MPGARSQKPLCASIYFSSSDVIPGAAHCLPVASHRGCRLRRAKPPPPGGLHSSEQVPTSDCPHFPLVQWVCVSTALSPGSAVLMGQTPTCPWSRGKMIPPCVFSHVAMKRHQLSGSKPNHPLCSAPACFLNKALWLLNIVPLPEELRLFPQLPSSSWSEHER